MVGAAAREQAIAQYLVTKVSWRGSYRRLLAVTPSSVLTFNPETFACTAHWEFREIETVEAADERDQFVLRLEKARLRLPRVRFHCTARAHLLALLTKLRRHFSHQPAAPQRSLNDAQAQWKKYRCIEFFGDGSSQAYYLQVDTSAVVLHDDAGRRMTSFPYIYMKRAVSTRSHPDGLVLVTPYQERLFLCSQRNQCLGEIYAAAGEIGVMLRWEESPLNVQLLRLRNSQLIDHPATVCFEVLKASDDGNCFMEVQLFLQDDALVEIHPKMRVVVARKYAKLLNVIRTDYDIETVGLEFAEGESLVVKLEARDQLIALLLLTCRENGYEQVSLSGSEIKKNRVYYPHPVEIASEAAGASMENFFLCRLLQTREVASEAAAVGGGRRGLLRRQSKPESSRSWQPRKAGRRKRSEAALVGSRDSFDTGESMNDFVSTSTAIEELNANVPLNEVDLFCQKELLNGAVELLAEQFTALVITLRRFVNSVNAEIVTTLQALVRLSFSSHAALPDQLIPRVFDAMHELFLQQDFLVCYWCLQLLQCYFDPARTEFIYGQRAKILQHILMQQELLSSLIALLPAASPASTRSSGFWLMGSDGMMEHMSRHSSLDSTLQSKEARLETEMNIVNYEALFTIHYITTYLDERGRQQAGGGSGSDEAPDGQAAQVLREFNTRSARRTDVTAGIFAKQKRFLAEKLVDKHTFLMDAVVDTRLVRTSLSCVALIQFLTLELGKAKNGTPTSAGATNVSRPNGCGTSASQPPMDESVSRRAVKNLSESTERGGSGLRQQQSRGGARFINFQDVTHETHDNHESDELPNIAANDELERKLEQLNEFLVAHAAKSRERDERSQGHRTTVVPLTGFSASSDEFAGSENTRASNYTKHLEVLPGELNGADSDGSNGNSGGSDGDDENEDKDEGDDDDDDDGDDEDKKSSVGPNPRERQLNFHAADADAPSSSSNARSENSNLANPRFQPSSNLFRSSTSYFEKLAPESDDSSNIGSNQRREQVQDRPLPSHSRHRRTTSAPNIRTNARHCDACVGCNDVCANVACFFCSEKKYQLKATFPDSPPTTRRETSSPSYSVVHDDSDNYVHTQRTYSSCELKRHRSLRSCWVVVSGEVYDITDLLSVHPGGLQVLLQAAQQGQDCAPIIEEHPLSARRVLSNYRLGEFYMCESQTMHP